MSTERIHPYEGLFLFPQAAMSNLQGAVDHIKMLLDRAGAELISLRKWEERRLAYEVKGNKRGVYFMVYFKAAASRMTALDRDCNLSEELLRVMITRADHLPLEQMEAADGQTELADEIRLRAERAETAAEEEVTAPAVEEPEPAEAPVDEALEIEEPDPEVAAATAEIADDSDEDIPV
ncbi:MAG: 30S ribosomal protein S6 [Phycisphaerales bacterium]|nr:MAG: 30S ribosomal protein S6 [Phycisphaerales bacterium]